MLTWLRGGVLCGHDESEAVELYSGSVMGWWKVALSGGSTRGDEPSVCAQLCSQTAPPPEQNFGFLLSPGARYTITTYNNTLCYRWRKGLWHPTSAAQGVHLFAVSCHSEGQVDIWKSASIGHKEMHLNSLGCRAGIASGYFLSWV